jgi:hypothetical protein
MRQLGRYQDQHCDAFREGLFVRALGRASSNNPYPPNSKESVLWQRGWRSIDAPGLSDQATPAIKSFPNFRPDAPLPVSTAPHLIRCIEVIFAVAFVVLGLAILIALSKAT